MSEYIVEWSGIGAEIVDTLKTEPHFMVAKRIRHRRKEQIVRCFDCKHSKYDVQIKRTICRRNCCSNWIVEPDGFCAWGEPKEEQ